MHIWPDSYQGAVSLSFDDGMDSQLNFAIPEMNDRGLLGTFYLNPRDTTRNNHRETWTECLKQWVSHQDRGHEIGNHTINHPCSLNINADWQKNNNLLDWNLDMIEKDILEAQKRLDTIFPRQKSNSFAYPCYESSVGRGLSRKSYTPIVAKYFSGARAKGELRGELANDPLYCDLHHLSSWAVERCTGAFMIGLVEQAVKHGRWGIFTIHGIHEGHLPVGSTDFLESIDYLNFRKNDVWTAPVNTISLYVQNLQNKISVMHKG